MSASDRMRWFLASHMTLVVEVRPMCRRTAVAGCVLQYLTPLDLDGHVVPRAGPAAAASAIVAYAALLGLFRAASALRGV